MVILVWLQVFVWYIYELSMCGVDVPSIWLSISNRTLHFPTINLPHRDTVITPLNNVLSKSQNDLNVVVRNLKHAIEEITYAKSFVDESRDEIHKYEKELEDLLAPIEAGKDRNRTPKNKLKRRNTFGIKKDPVKTRQAQTFQVNNLLNEARETRRNKEMDLVQIESKNGSKLSQGMESLQTMDSVRLQAWIACIKEVAQVEADLVEGMRSSSLMEGPLQAR